MKQKGITPFTWCGGDGGYRMDLLNEVWLRYEGYANFNLNNTFNGEYTFPESRLTAEEAAEWNATTNSDGSQTVKITAENGYLLQKQEGKLVALNFAKDILSDTAYYSVSGLPYFADAHGRARGIFNVYPPGRSDQTKLPCSLKAAGGKTRQSPFLTKWQNRIIHPRGNTGMVNGDSASCRCRFLKAAKAIMHCIWARVIPPLS